MDRLLFKLRNVEGRCTHKAVTKAAPLELEITVPDRIVALNGFLVEDMSIPGHANGMTTREFWPELPLILNGESERWHLWEAIVYDKRLVLNYADRESKGKNPACTALRCSYEFRTNIEMTLRAPVGNMPYCRIRYCAFDTVISQLTLTYPDAEDKKQHTDSYDVRPLMF